MVVGGGNIGISSAGGVVETVELTLKASDVSVNHVELVVGSAEVVGETTAAIRLNRFVDTVVDGTADSSDPRATGRELGKELLESSAVGLASIGVTNAAVTGRGKDTDTTGSKLKELGADSLNVVRRDGSLIIAVGDGIGLSRAIGSNSRVKPIEVGLVVVGGVVANGDERRSSTDRVEDILKRIGQWHSDLAVKVGFTLTRRGGASAVDGLNLKRRVGRDLRVILLQEELQVVEIRDLLKEASDSKLGSAIAGRSVSLNVVVLTKALARCAIGKAGRDIVGNRSPGNVGCQDGLENVSGAHAKIGEEGGGLHHGNVRVNIAGKTVAGGTDSLAASGSLGVDTIIGVEELLGLFDADADADVTAVHLASVNAVQGQPSGDGIDSILGRSNQSINFGLGQMLAVLAITRVADLKCALLELVEVLFLEANVQIDLVIGRSSLLKGETLRDSGESLLGHESAQWGGSGKGSHENRHEEGHVCDCSNGMVVFSFFRLLP